MASSIRVIVPEGRAIHDNIIQKTNVSSCNTKQRIYKEQINNTTPVDFAELKDFQPINVQKNDEDELKNTNTTTSQRCMTCNTPTSAIDRMIYLWKKLQQIKLF